MEKTHIDIQQKLKWINVNDKLPLQNVEDGVYDKFLVTVYPKNPDRNDESGVMFLYFHNKTNHFSYQPGGKPYEDDNCSWKVTHWTKSPKPSRGWNQSIKEEIKGNVI